MVQIKSILAVVSTVAAVVSGAAVMSESSGISTRYIYNRILFNQYAYRARWRRVTV